jgi:hypothetical protein
MSKENFKILFGQIKLSLIFHNLIQIILMSEMAFLLWKVTGFVPIVVIAIIGIEEYVKDV